MEYNFREIEKKWQHYWAEKKTFKVEVDPQKPKYYVLDMFPYPSGAGLHVGHPLGYIASDVYARYMRHKGYNVLHPMGYDAYGLPAEQYAIQTGTHPAITTGKNINRYREQMDKIGFAYDWDREVRTCDPKYYKWTQWTFIQLFNSWYNNKTGKAETIRGLKDIFKKEGNVHIDAACSESISFTASEWSEKQEKEQQEILMNYRLAYLSDTWVNWCPDLGTVLANDEVKDGFSERGGHPVERKLMKQWSLRITAYAQRLLDGLDHVDWFESLKEVQRNWIGRSEGASVMFYLSPTLSKGEGDKTTDLKYFETDKTKPGFFNTDSQMWSVLKDKAKEMRRKPTEEEAVLWERLRAKQLGYKFRRQHAIDEFIVDFVCLSKKTIIEIDGKIHEKQIKADEARTEILNKYGYSILRFKNEEVLRNPDVVVQKIKDFLNKKVLPFGEDLAGVQVFTTRPDTLWGATFMVLAPEHELVDKITTPEHKEAVKKYIARAKNRSERDRLAEVKKITGEFTGAYAINPVNGQKIPIWIADYVLSGYGTGAIMAVPGHDSRDFKFARHFQLPIVQVVKKKDEEPTNPQGWDDSYDAKEGIMINSGFIDGLEVNEAIRATIKWLEENGVGRGEVNYRLRDAIFSRQRYWGEPFPVYYKAGMPYVVDEKELPLELPEVDTYLPTESGEPPLARAKDWKNKEGYPLETNTMPGFAGSSGYYLRYMDPHNDKAYFSKEANLYWRDVDLYIGGDEHGTGHLIYARFWNKFLFDLGLACEDEPFKRLINQGKIQGRSSFVYRINGTNTFVSYHLRKDYETTALHVDIDLVEHDILNIEAFRKWRPEFAQVEFILEDGKYVCGWEIEKMSKSKHNVQNPDDLIGKYGTDTFRLYEMFLGPLETHKPWDTQGIEGVFRFIKKLWRLYHDHENNLNISEEKAGKDELKSLHKAIKKVGEDIERISLNTVISTYMICVNELTELKCNKREILEPLAILMSPNAPHIAEELWQLLGHKESIANAPFPEFNASFIQEHTFAYPVSFNGKMRFKLELPLDVAREEAEKSVLEAEAAQRWLAGKEPRKIIFVPRKIINVVI